MTACEHLEDDENFLLDDDNTAQRNCIKCLIVSPDTPKENSYRGEALNGLMFHNGNRGSMSSTIVDDHSDNLEDSPLLINDIYRESVVETTEFHCHDSLSATEDTSAWKKLCMAAAFCFLFMVAEVVGGYLAGSLAIMTDAAHLFSDFIGFLISLLAIWVARKPPSRNMTFGYYRAEVVGALLSVLSIWLLAAIFSTLAINRIYYQDYEIDANTMIIIASLGLTVNIIMGGILHGVCHAHGHAPHAHVASNNINVRAAAIHVLGDLLQSVGVLAAALIVKFCPDAQIADPICTLIFSALVVCTTIRVAKDSLWFLIEGSPINTWKLRAELLKIAAVKHIHSLHIWSLSPGKNVAAVHLAVDEYCDRDLLLEKATSAVQRQINVMSCTIQIEAYNQALISSCRQCQSVQIR
ncbi:proton-coupled zinc antiporter SLC30A2 isoform X1 [Leptinotarsa decemlineata]|uniref:proton-coupled zinc antiporter SLC30A2 isoform X1 n=1 Tax=Leptinotarsa decemlineata TaxID=7539 RepID=UPI003D308660